MLQLNISQVWIVLVGKSVKYLMLDVLQYIFGGMLDVPKYLTAI
jgi:hypothetical protein